MKRATIILLAVVVGITFTTVVDADAGWFGKDKKEKEDKRIHRYDKYPTMEFHKGVLGRGLGVGWRLGELDVQFMKDCEIYTDGTEEGSLREGRTAVIMGSRWGNTIVAWQVRVLSQEESYDTHEAYDPNVVLTEGATKGVSVGVAPQ